MAISLATADGVHFLRAYADGRVAADASAVGEIDELWNVAFPFADDRCVLQAAVHQRYVTAHDDGRLTCLATEVNAWELFHLVRVSGGWQFISVHGSFVCAEGGGGGEVRANRQYGGPWETFAPSGLDEPDQPQPGGVLQLRGPVRQYGHSFGDDSGPRLVHGCSDFCALAKHHEDRDTSLRQLDVVAQHRQYIRVCWRINGWKFADAGLSTDPIRDPWFEETFLDYARACHDRGIRLSLTTADMFNWSDSQARQWFRRVAEMSVSVSEHLVWLSAVANEMRGTWPGGESDANIQFGKELLNIWLSVCPHSMTAISDPGSQDRDGMKKLARTAALIHDVRWGVSDAIRRAFNTQYEGFPGVPIVQDEPTGENGNVPPPFGQNVWQPVNDDDDILAIYTTHVYTGQASTYFSDPSLVSREPLEATWGFTNLPRLWREMEIPEDIGQGMLYHGGKSGSPFNVINSHADRADCIEHGHYVLGVISGGSNWRVKSRRSGTVTTWTGKGRQFEGPISAGQVIPAGGPTPTVVRIVG